MMILVTYDVDFTNSGGQRRLRKVAKLCENYGIRVQNSVFELIVDTGQYVIIKHSMEKIIDSKLDSVRFYILGKSWKNKIETLGKEADMDQTGTIII